MPPYPWACGQVTPIPPPPMTPRRSFVALVALMLACVATPVVAQETAAAAVQPTAPASSTKGIFIGAHLNGSSIKFTDATGDAENGSGLALQLGYGFTPRLALLVDVTGANIRSSSGDYALAHVDLLARYAWTSTERAFVPFIEGGFSGMGASQDVRTTSGSTSTVTISGSGATFGGGAQYYVAPSFAVGVALKWTTGSFTELKVDNQTQSGYSENATTARFNLGVTWYPRTR